VVTRAVFGIADLLACSSALLRMGEDAACMEDVAADVVTCLRETFIDKDTGESALPLARFYVTRRTDQLEPELQDFARAAGTDARAGVDVTCLTLLATAGEATVWNDRHASVSHKAIPLPSVEVLHRSPMVAQLIGQLGLDPRHIVHPDPALLRDLSQKTYNVFYVADALDSPYVPAQESFVVPYGIRSVVGFGGLLPNGSLFAIILFSRIAIPALAVDGFAAIALAVKIAILPLQHRVFTHDRRNADTLDQVALREAQLETALTLLEARASVVEPEAQRLEQEARDADERAAALEATNRALELSEARKTAIVEGALDCVIGMDASGRITEFNHTAEGTFGYRREEVVGELLGDTLVPFDMRERHRQGLATLLATGQASILDRRMEVNALRRGGEEFPVELLITQVAHAEPPLFTGYLRDLTGARQASAELIASRERLARIARTLQASFLPAVLPEVAGLDLSAAFHAMGEGYEVGGDFYDVFRLDDSRWAFTLGDVCGKGSEAAVVTALARYTIRAAAMQDPQAAFVLETLNRAINEQYPTMFCTVVYVVVDIETGSVELALGGHPHPLLLRPDGVVSEVGASGLLLGPFEHWTGSTTTFTLQEGELLLLYSDGVTEARSGESFYGDARLASILGRAAGLDASAAVALIEADVLRFGDALFDDVAVLAVRRAMLER